KLTNSHELQSFPTRRSSDLNIAKNELALATGVTSINDVRDIFALDELNEHFQSLGRAFIVGFELKLWWNDRQVRKCPFSTLGVIRRNKAQLNSSHVSNSYAV